MLADEFSLSLRNFCFEKRTSLLLIVVCFVVAKELNLCLSGKAPPAEAASATHQSSVLSEIGHATRLDFVDVATAW